MRERKSRSRRESLVRLRGSLIPYTYNIYKIKRKVKRKNTMRIYSPSDLGESMNGIIRLDRLTIFVAESLVQTRIIGMWEFGDFRKAEISSPFTFCSYVSRLRLSESYWTAYIQLFAEREDK
jgi:hypothetical protein